MSHQVLTSYTLRFLKNIPDNILKVNVIMTGSKVKSWSYHDVAHLHALTNVPTKYQLSTLYGLRYSSDKILEVKVTTARSKVKSRSDHDVAHLHHLTNVPTIYQLSTPCSFRYIVWTRFSNSWSLRQSQRRNHSHIMTLHF